MNRYFFYFSPLLLVLIFLGWLPTEEQRPTETLVAPAEKIRGVSWEAARGTIGEEHIESLCNYHVNWVAQTPFGWQAEYDQPEIAYSGSRGYWGERDSGLVATACLAREIGVKTMLKPHIWLRGRADGKWRSDIEMNSHQEWDEWFANYEAFILYYARLAEQYDFEAFCIGTELYIASSQHEHKWRDLIAKVRKVYSGQLTYAANFYKEYEAIAFWDALDFIGVQAYFSLANQNQPSVKTLQKGWRPHFEKLKKMNQKWNKPVVFTEVGYRSSKDAAIKPWEWPQRGEVPSEKICTQTQAHCYQAMFETFWQEDWMQGVFLWKWSPANYGYQTSNSSRRRHPSPVSFAPKEEGLEVLQAWFGK